MAWPIDQWFFIAEPQQTPATKKDHGQRRGGLHYPSFEKGGKGEVAETGWQGEGQSPNS